MTREVPLTRGMVSLVDDDDYERVMDAASWHAVPGINTFYGQRSTRQWLPDGRLHRSSQRLHAFITGWPMTDHINGDGLDNRRANLRPANSSENTANCRISRANTSGYKGVSWLKRAEKWVARIGNDKERIWIGRFTDPVSAALAYDEAARSLYGPFARVNFPREGEFGAREDAA